MVHNERNKEIPFTIVERHKNPRNDTTIEYTCLSDHDQVLVPLSQQKVSKYCLKFKKRSNFKIPFRYHDHTNQIQIRLYVTRLP